MFRLHKTYLFLTAVLFFTEVVIALFVHDRFVRPYVGDFLVVILLYCFVRSFFNLPVLIAGAGVLLFSFCVEVAQYFQLVSLLHLDDHQLAKTVIGQSFEWIDMLAYTLGILFVLLAESYFQKNSRIRFVQKS